MRISLTEILVLSVVQTDSQTGMPSSSLTKLRLCLQLTDAVSQNLSKELFFDDFTIDTNSFQV